MSYGIFEPIIAAILTAMGPGTDKLTGAFDGEHLAAGSHLPVVPVSHKMKSA